MRLILPLLLTLAGCSSPAGHAVLLEGGDFESDGAAWPEMPGATIECEHGDHFLRLCASAPGRTIVMPQQVPVAGMTALEIGFRARWSDIVAGDRPGAGARLALAFRGEDGRELAGVPDQPTFSGGSDAWMPSRLRLDVPAGAAILSLSPELDDASGTLDIDDIVVEPERN